jgi:hypothetical protein
MTSSLNSKLHNTLISVNEILRLTHPGFLQLSQNQPFGDTADGITETPTICE